MPDSEIGPGVEDLTGSDCFLFGVNARDLVSLPEFWCCPNAQTATCIKNSPSRRNAQQALRDEDIQIRVMPSENREQISQALLDLPQVIGVIARPFCTHSHPILRTTGRQLPSSSLR